MRPNRFQPSTVEKAKKNPEIVKSAPNNTQFGGMDEVKAGREGVLCWWMPEGYDTSQ